MGFLTTLVMKSHAVLILLIAAYALAQSGSGQPWQQNAIYLESNFDWANIDLEIQNAIDAGYTHIYIGFYMSLYGCQAACTAWTQLPSSQKQNTLNYAAQNGAQILLAVGGPGESPEYVIQQGTSYINNYATGAASYAKSNSFQRMDFCIHLAGESTVPSQWATNGSLVNYAKTLVNAGSTVGYQSNQLTLTGQAPYFSVDFVGGSISNALSYLALDSNAAMPFYVGQINLQMFNEDSNYMSYYDIFIQNTYSDPAWGSFGKGSSIKEVRALGITQAGIAVGKPVTDHESAVKTGYISPQDLGAWGCMAQSDFGWTGGFIGWTWQQADEY